MERLTDEEFLEVTGRWPNQFNTVPKDSNVVATIEIHKIVHETGCFDIGGTPMFLLRSGFAPNGRFVFLELAIKVKDQVIIHQCGFFGYQDLMHRTVRRPLLSNCGTVVLKWE